MANKFPSNDGISAALGYPGLFTGLVAKRCKGLWIQGGRLRPAEATLNSLVEQAD